MTLGEPWPILRHAKILQLRLLHGENVTMMDSVEIIASCDLEFG